jgi:hypothetical protein
MSVQNHEILVAKRYPTGAEEWYCPTCGRHYIVRWTPEYQCMVLNEGDEKSIHNMSRGAQIVLSREIAREENLAPWLAWLEGVDLEKKLGEEEPLD